VPQTDISLQSNDIVRLEHIADEPVGFAGIYPAAFFGHDAGGVLATVLQHGQRIIDGQVDGLLPYDADDSAHCSFP
jgi:hypothetical protein